MAKYRGDWFLNLEVIIIVFQSTVWWLWHTEMFNSIPKGKKNGGSNGVKTPNAMLGVTLRRETNEKNKQQKTVMFE